MIRLTNPLCEFHPMISHRQAVACALTRVSAAAARPNDGLRVIEGDRELPTTRKQVQ